MCTAMLDCGVRPLFGRTLDLECSYGERGVCLERDHPLAFFAEPPMGTHASIKGMAYLYGDVPLFYDAVNEHGLAMAALNFPHSAVYHQKREGMYNLASFELIGWVLGQCKTLAEAVVLLRGTNILSDSISPTLPATPLHWMIADRNGSVVAEPLTDGLMVVENPYGVLTNEPPFAAQVANLAQYRHLSPHAGQNLLCPSAELPILSRGTGAVGLPGDWSSPSRFVRAVFVKTHTVDESAEAGNLGEACERAVNRFFHMMESVSLPLGVVRTERGDAVQTQYTSCADLLTGEYYYHTYDCWEVRRAAMIACG